MNGIEGIVIPTAYMFLIFLCTAYLVNESYNPFYTLDFKYIIGGGDCFEKNKAHIDLFWVYYC